MPIDKESVDREHTFYEIFRNDLFKFIQKFSHRHKVQIGVEITDFRDDK